METLNRIRVWTLWVSLSLAAALISACGEAEHAETLVVVSWGGSFQEAQRQAIFQPFTRETGISILEETGPSLARVKAMVDAGRADWDVALMTPADVMRLQAEGYLAPIDYSDPELRTLVADIDERAVAEFGLADFFTSKVIAYNTNVYSREVHPRSWEEFWDVERFPGPRVIDAGDWSVPPIEYALLADGVGPDDLYPLDFERAYESIERLAPHVLKFSSSPVMPAQALVDGEAVLVAVTQGRIAQLKAQGAPVDFEWNEGLLDVNYWVILGNSERYESAMKFIKYVARPDVQAAFARLQPLGPSNRKAFELLDADRARQLPTYPQNLARQIWLDSTFWVQTDEHGVTNAERNAQMWRRFALSRR